MLSFSAYSSQEWQPEIKLSIDKLYENQMEITLEQFELKYVWQADWNRYNNYLCIENFFEVEDFSVNVDVTQRFGECYKVLIDCILDFGQFPEGDRTEKGLDKPFSPFAQFFDECELSSLRSFQISEWQPFESLTNGGVWY